MSLTGHESQASSLQVPESFLSFHSSVLHPSSTNRPCLCPWTKRLFFHHWFFNCLLQNTWELFPLKQKSVPLVQHMPAIISLAEHSGLHELRVFLPPHVNDKIWTKPWFNFQFYQNLCWVTGLAQVTEFMFLTHPWGSWKCSWRSFQLRLKSLGCSCRGFQFLPLLAQHGEELQPQGQG